MNKFILLFSLGLFSINANSQSNESLKNWEFIERTDLDRIYNDTLVFIEKNKLSSHSLYEVFYLEVDNKENLIFFDRGKQKIVYLPEGNIENFRLIGYGEGRGPGEFINPFDLKFDSGGNIWLADVEKMEIQKWSPSGDFQFSFQIDKYARPAKLAVSDSGYIYILSEQYTPNGVIYMYDTAGEKLLSFQKPENRDYRSVLYFEGELQVYNEDLIMSGRVKPFLRRYSKDGNLQYSKGIINFKNVSNILVKEKRWRSRNKELIRATVDLQVFNNIIYAGISNRVDRWIRIIDMYSGNGNYISSIRLSNPARNFAVHGDNFFTLEYNYNDKEIYLSKYNLLKK